MHGSMDGHARLDGELPFDLNIGTVLEHWPVAFAIREVIANALDEHLISGTAEPTITADRDGRWHIVDHGRGLRYEHLTQDESPEKRRHPEVIGQFGMGLKDALAVFDRRGVTVEIRSPHGDITTSRQAKEQFADVVTLHAIVRPPADPERIGTDVILTGVEPTDVEEAKRFFLRYSDDQILETTKYGQVVAPPATGTRARVYVKGLLVAEEDNFLFSYNITDLNAPLRRALNRERSNVGRGAYSDRVKAILKACESAEVAGPLADDLAAFSSGRQHDEVKWEDVAVHACRVLATHQQAVFVTARQLEQGSPQLQYAKEEGYRLVVVADNIARKLKGLTDLAGRPLMDLAAYREAWNEGFSFAFVAPDDLDADERAIFDLTDRAAEIAGFDRAQLGVEQVLVSETMRLSESGHQVVGLWDATERRVVIHREQLRSLERWCGTLLHELVHADTGTNDGSLDFEEALTEVIGVLSKQTLTAQAAPDG
jgi:hypothetical protein